MGTGILALAVALSPLTTPPLHAVAAALWMATLALFIALLLLWLAHGLRDPNALRTCLDDPVRAPLWGAPPIACLTLATGFLVIGRPLAGPGLAPALLVCAQALWLAGVAGSLFSSLAVPYLMFTRHELSLEMTSGTWLLPVVPTLVAAVPGALLTSSWPAGWRPSMLALSYALWGIGAILSAIIVVLFVARLAYNRIPSGALVTTVWIVLGPVGMSITGIDALGAAASAVWPAFGPTLRIAGLAYSLPAWGFGVYWLALTVLVTLRAARTQLPFTLGWWAFTFPVGVLTTGTYALYRSTQASLFATAGVAFLLLLATLWTLVAIYSVRQCVTSVRNALVTTTPQSPLTDAAAA
jgi:C4-dicarboxylate transporter/malic acid transport protein